MRINCLIGLIIASFALNIAFAAKYQPQYPCSKRCFKDQAYANRCPNECYQEWEPYKVDYACVDFCLDYRHSLHECQRNCSN